MPGVVTLRFTVPLDTGRADGFWENLSIVCEGHLIDKHIQEFKSSYASAFVITLQGPRESVYWVIGWCEGVSGTNLAGALTETDEKI